MFVVCDTPAPLLNTLQRERFGLQLLQLVVHALLRDELLVGTLLGNLALVDDNQRIGVAKRRETMRDGNGRAALDKHVDGLLNRLLGLRVDSRSRLVEPMMVS